MKLKASVLTILVASLAGAFAGCDNSAGPAGSGAATLAQPGAGSLLLRVAVPKHQGRPGASSRAPHYVSPATQAMTVAIAGPTSVVETVGLQVSSKGCSSTLAGTQCVLRVPGLAPCPKRGNCYAATIATYDAYDSASNTIPATANELSSATHVPFRIVAGKGNAIGLTLDGIATSVAIVPTANSALSGNMTSGFTLSACASQQVGVFGIDADGNYVLGAGAPLPGLASDDTKLLAVATPMPSAPNQFGLIVAPEPGSASVVQLTASATSRGKSPSTASTQVRISFESGACGAFPDTTYTAGPADTPLAAATIPPPFDPSSPLSQLARTRLRLSAKPPRVPRSFFLRRAAVATAPPNDHEAYGVFMSASQGDAPPYDAVFSTQTAYEPSQNPLPYPAGASGSETIFVPTTHMAWGACLENGTQYFDASSSSETKSQFYVFDFCQTPNKFIAYYDVDAAFLNDYVRYLDVGYPSYVIESFTPDLQPNQNSTWYSLLYNFTTQRYDVVGSDTESAAFSTASIGWSQAEPYAPAGPCPQIAPAVLGNLSLYDTLTAAWEPVTPLLAGGAISSVEEEGGSNDSCFNGSAGGPGTLMFTLTSANSGWTTVSPRTPAP